MHEFKIGRSSKRCCVADRLLRPGEIYYSVVSEVGDELVRRDISAEAWQTPPEDAIGWWKNRVPLPEDRKREMAPPAVLIDLLRMMQDHPSRRKSRYLLALMLLRSRHLKAHESLPRDDGREQDVLVLQSPIDQSILEVDVVAVQSDEAEALRGELMELIYRDVE